MSDPGSMAAEKTDPIALFKEWLEEARATALKEPTAVSLATADASGRPSARIVLLKDVSERGFTFYTNLESNKGRDLRENPQAALCFYWMPLDRQVRVEGRVEPVADATADAYFASRERMSRIGAWASKQSRPMLEGKWELEKRVAKYTARYPLGDIPRPPFWSGFIVIPDRIEFWSLKPFRLHERRVFLRRDEPAADGEKWDVQYLFP